MFSTTLRRIYREYYAVELGEYSYGPGIIPGVFPNGTVIGRFSSFAAGLQVLDRNHPVNRLSQHPFAYNQRFSPFSNRMEKNMVGRPVKIGGDVWIGLNVIITPGCHEIGNGAIVGAGSVVTKDVAPFTIVAGNPARLIRRRFPEKVEAAVAQSAWWERSLSEIGERFDLFQRPLTAEDAPLIARAFGNGKEENS